MSVWEVPGEPTKAPRRARRALVGSGRKGRPIAATVARLEHRDPGLARDSGLSSAAMRAGLRDYRARRLPREIEALPIGGWLRAAATHPLQARLGGWNRRPKQSDLLIMATSFILLALSFLISLFASLAGA